MSRTNIYIRKPVCVLSRPRAPRVAHRARARETVCAVLCSDAHAHAVLCGVPCTRCRVCATERQHSVWGHRRDDTWGLSLEQATASIHSLSRVRLQFSEREMQVAPGGHTSNYSYPPLPPGVAHTVRWEYATLPRDPSRTTPASRTHKCLVARARPFISSRESLSAVALQGSLAAPHGNARLRRRECHAQTLCRGGQEGG